ncbi:glycosyltransferase [Romboutsia sp.]
MRFLENPTYSCCHHFVIEALASGCNVVTTDIPGVKGWIKLGKNYV